MLTLKDLKEMEHGEIFDSGFEKDDEKGIFLTGSGIELKWVACRGDGFHDWCIYCDYAHLFDEWVKAWGNKVHDERTIKRLVPCDKEAFKLYRH